MSFHTDLDRTLHSHLDVIELPLRMPANVEQRARQRRRVKLYGVSLASAIGIAAASLGIIRLPDLNISPATPKPIPFENLPVKEASRTFGLVGSPLAPAQFPDCTSDNVDVRPGTGDTFVGVTIRPLEDVQCGLRWWSDGHWTDANGKVFDPPRATADQYIPRGDGGRSFTHGRLLLMGAAGAQHAGNVAGQVCGLEPPITYSIKLGDGAVELGTIDDPGCLGTDKFKSRDAWELPYSYLLGGTETPMAFLDPSLEVVDERTDHVLQLMLTLTNDTGETITVGRCPFYDVTFTTKTGSSHLRSYLNCPEAPDEVGPGRAVRFRVDVPVDGDAGAGAIRFVLRDENRPLHRLRLEATP